MKGIRQRLHRSNIENREGLFLTDRQIIAEVLAGNTPVYAQLIRRYEGQVAATVIGMLGKTAEAEDVAQEVFIRFYRALPGFRHDSAVATYLTRIAINLSLNALQRRKKQKELFRENVDEQLSGIPAAEENEYSEEVRLIRQAITQLDEDQRAVIVLRLIDGYSTKETAEILNIPLGTVLSRLNRAQKKLRQILTPLLEVNNG